jgi:predicted TIM-barrel fold metal-dependent hydrolase
MARLGTPLYFLFSALVIASPASITAQTLPAADHHAHLQSTIAARLLNEGAIPQPDEPHREEKPHVAADLIAQLDAAGIRRSIALSDAYRLGSPFVHIPKEAAAVDAENEWTLRQVRIYPKRLVGFCSINPTRPYALAAIEHCARIGLRGGLKLHLANAQFNFDDPGQIRKLRDAFATADHLRMPILIHLRSDTVWDAKRNVQIFMSQVLPSAPDVPVQIAHLGGWGGYDRTTDDILSTFAYDCAAHAAQCRRLYFDIAAVVLDPADANAVPGSDDRFLWDQQKDFTDGTDRLAANLRRIGLSHILFATDWPVTNASDYILTLRTKLRLTPGEIDQIFRNLAPYFNKPATHTSESLMRSTGR